MSDNKSLVPAILRRGNKRLASSETKIEVTEDRAEKDRMYEEARTRDFSDWWQNTQTFIFSRFERILKPFFAILSIFSPGENRVRGFKDHVETSVDCFGVFGQYLIVGFSNGRISLLDISKDFAIIRELDTLIDPEHRIQYFLTCFSDISFVAITDHDLIEYSYLGMGSDWLSREKSINRINAMIGSSLPVLLLDDSDRIIEVAYSPTQGLGLTYAMNLRHHVSRMIDLKCTNQSYFSDIRPVLCTWGGFAAILNLANPSQRNLTYWKKTRFPGVDEWHSVKYEVYENHVFFAEIRGPVGYAGESFVNVSSLHHFGVLFNYHKLEIKSGVIRDYNLHENFLFVFTSSDDIEVFCAIQLRKSHHIKPGCWVTASLLVNSYLILGTRGGDIVSLKLHKGKKKRCCNQCKRFLPKGPHIVRICRHEIPEHKID